MRVRFALLLSGILGLTIPLKSSAAIIDAYNFGPTSTSFTYAATTLAANVTASGINSVLGSNTTLATDDGLGGNWYSNNAGGGNYLTVSTTGSSTDNGFWIETVVTAAAGYVIDPSSVELFGGAGGSSNVRSAYIYDNVDGYPTNIATTLNAAPTFTGGDQLATGPFTAIRGSGGTVSMNEIQAASLPSDDVNLSSFTVRVYFDTQGQVSKSIDLGLLELDGSVVAVPEPATFALVALAAVAGLRRRRQIIAGQ